MRHKQSLYSSQFRLQLICSNLSLLGGVVLVQDENEGGFVAQPYNAAEANRLKALEEEE